MKYLLLSLALVGCVTPTPHQEVIFTTCPRTSMISWVDVTIQDVDAYETAKRNCARKLRDNRTCLAYFEKVARGTYNAVCGLPEHHIQIIEGAVSR